MMLMELIAHPHWFWLTLGGLLLAAEMLGTSGYLLWSGVADRKSTRLNSSHLTAGLESRMPSSA